MLVPDAAVTERFVCTRPESGQEAVTVAEPTGEGLLKAPGGGPMLNGAPVEGAKNKVLVLSSP
jgi:hypothetical protein